MAGKAQKAGKSKRPQSERKKMQRASCRRRAAETHEANARQQELRHGHNLRLARDGELTPWQQACAARAARRLITCAKDRALFEDKSCPLCGSTMNLKAAWEKRNTANQLPAA